MIMSLIISPFIFIILINILLIFLSINQHAMKSVEGRVIERDIIKKSYPTKQPKSEGPAFLYTFMLSIKYCYVVKEREYSSKRINFSLFDTQYPDELSINQVMGELVHNDKILVFYNPIIPFVPIVQKTPPQIGMNVLIISLCVAAITSAIFAYTLI